MMKQSDISLREAEETGQTLIEKMEKFCDFPQLKIFVSSFYIKRHHIHLGQEEAGRRGQTCNYEKGQN